MSDFLLRLASASIFLAASGVVAALALRCLRVRSPRIHATCWWLVLIQGLFVFHVSLEIPWFPALQTRTDAFASGTVNASPPVVETTESVTGGNVESVPVVTPVTEQFDSQRPSNLMSSGFAWPGLLLAGWAIGILLIVGKWVWNYGWFCRTCCGEECTESAWTNEWQTLVEESGIRSRVSLSINDQIGPLICWLPSGYRLIVPARLWERLDRTQRLCILRHELAHYERCDLWKSLFSRLSAAIHWFNPVAWWAVRQIERSSEWACDDAVTAAGQQWSTSYAKALLAAGELGIAPPKWSPGASGSGLPMRIRRVLSLSKAEESSMKTATPVIALLILATLNVIRVELVAQEQAPTQQSQIDRIEPERLGADAARNESDDVAQVLETWQARQDAIKSFSIQWVAAVHSPSGQGPQKVFPVTGELHIDESGRVRLDWTSVNSGRRGRGGWRESDLYPQRSITTVQGIVETRLIPEGSQGFPVAVFREAKPLRVSSHLWLSPINLALRPLDQSSTYFVQQAIQETSETDAVDGIPCRILEAGPNSIWVTDDDRHLILRLIRRDTSGDSAKSDTQISYQQQGDGSWVPDTWRVTYFRGDEIRVREARYGKVTEVSLNVVIPEETFDMKFPSGTWVTNVLTDEVYITREGKPNRPVLPGEYTGDNYEAILNSEPPSQPGDNEKSNDE